MIRHLGPELKSTGVNAIGEVAEALDNATIGKGFGPATNPGSVSAVVTKNDVAVEEAVVGPSPQEKD